MTTLELIEAAVSAFKERSLSSPAEADHFFAEFGIGNLTDSSHIPHERFRYYRDLLTRLREVDVDKFLRVHKGTPLYFLSWLAFDLHQFEAGLQHLDAAIAEDKRLGEDWCSKPGAQFVLLNENIGSARRTIESLSQRVEKELLRFSATYHELSRGTLVQKFAEPLLRQGRLALVAGFYGFLLEFDDRVREIEMRSSPVLGSYQPLYIHLFKGGLLLETLLKTAIPGATGTLGHLFQDCNEFEQRIGFRPGSIQTVPIQTLCTDARTITPSSAFQTTGRLRNTMGHSLILDPLPSPLDDYRALAEREIDAFLFAVTKLYP